MNLKQLKGGRRKKQSEKRRKRWGRWRWMRRQRELRREVKRKRSRGVEEEKSLGNIVIYGGLAEKCQPEINFRYRGG